jgi:nucleoside-diphosphate-sugar epimerase
MTTLVTGAGLIGAAFAREALQRGEKVVFVDLEPRTEFLRFKLGHNGFEVLRKDIRDLPALVEVMTSRAIKTVVHTAGLIGGRVQQSLSLAFDINLNGTRNVAEAARLAGVRRFVQISTFGVYDPRRMATKPIEEDFPRGGRRGYGCFKGAVEQILDAYAEAYGFELIMLRPANVFGFGHFSAGSSGGMKMQALIEAGLDGGVARIPAAETMDNEYVYAADVGRAVDRAATIAMPRDYIFNIGSGRITPYAELLDTAKALFPKMIVETLPGEPPKSKNQPLDLSRTQESLGWEPRFSLHDALTDYADELRRARAQLTAFDR